MTDSGSAFCKAFNLYGRKVDALVEAVEPTPDDINDDMADIPFMQYEDGECFYSNIISFNEIDSDFTDDQEIVRNQRNSSQNYNDNEIELNADGDVLSDADEFELMDPNTKNDIERENHIAPVLTRELPPHRRCQSHQLNSVNGGFEKELTEKALTCYSKTSEKLPAIWVFPRRSSHAKSIAKEISGCVLKIPCETRWNSKYDAVSQIQSLQSILSKR